MIGLTAGIAYYLPGVDQGAFEYSLGRIGHACDDLFQFDAQKFQRPAAPSRLVIPSGDVSQSIAEGQQAADTPRGPPQEDC